MVEKDIVIFVPNVVSYRSLSLFALYTSSFPFYVVVFLIPIILPRRCPSNPAPLLPQVRCCWTSRSETCRASPPGSWTRWWRATRSPPTSATPWSASYSSDTNTSAKTNPPSGSPPEGRSPRSIGKGKESARTGRGGGAGREGGVCVRICVIFKF